jgi:hypothetical protein
MAFSSGSKSEAFPLSAFADRRMAVTKLRSFREALLILYFLNHLKLEAAERSAYVVRTRLGAT